MASPKPPDVEPPADVDDGHDSHQEPPSGTMLARDVLSMSKEALAKFLQDHRAADGSYQPRVSEFRKLLRCDRSILKGKLR